MKKLIVSILYLITAHVAAQGEVNHKAINVSLIQLISNPGTYNNKVVRIIGVAQIEFEGNIICLSKEHFKYGITKNCLWHSPNYKKIIATPEILSKYNGKYVLMEGTFNMNNQGHRGMTSGALENVTRYELWEQ